DHAKRVVEMRIPDIEQVATTGGKDPINLTIGPVLVGKNITPNWQTTASKLASAKGSAVASAGRTSTCSTGRNFVRAISSIGGLRSVAVKRTPLGRASRK